jgi:SAM-dependent methyltransferase
MKPRPEGPMADEHVTRDHYDRLAATYDENWAYSPAFVAWMTGAILRRLQLTGADVVADIGCGTGAVRARARVARGVGGVRGAVGGDARAGPGR